MKVEYGSFSIVITFSNLDSPADIALMENMVKVAGNIISRRR